MGNLTPTPRLHRPRAKLPDRFRGSGSCSLTPENGLKVPEWRTPNLTKGSRHVRQEPAFLFEKVPFRCSLLRGSMGERQSIAQKGVRAIDARNSWLENGPNAAKTNVRVLGLSTDEREHPFV